MAELLDTDEYTPNWVRNSYTSRMYGIYNGRLTMKDDREMAVRQVIVCLYPINQNERMKSRAPQAPKRAEAGP